MGVGGRACNSEICILGAKFLELTPVWKGSTIVESQKSFFPINKKANKHGIVPICLKWNR